MAAATPSSTRVISFHDLAYLPMKRCLESAIAITKKAQMHLSSSSTTTSSETSTSTAEAELVNARLAPDMYPFWEQCYLLHKTTSQLVQRLTAPSSTTSTSTFPDPPRPAQGDITTLQECIDLLLQPSLAELSQCLLPSHEEDGGFFSDDQIHAQTSVTYGPVICLPVTKSGFVQGMTLPNMFFHLSVAYAILRMKGVPLGKADYMTPFFVDYVDTDVLAGIMGARAAAAAGGAGAPGEKKAEGDAEKV